MLAFFPKLTQIWKLHLWNLENPLIFHHFTFSVHILHLQLKCTFSILLKTRLLFPWFFIIFSQSWPENVLTIRLPVGGHSIVGKSEFRKNFTVIAETTTSCCKLCLVLLLQQIYMFYAAQISGANTSQALQHTCFQVRVGTPRSLSRIEPFRFPKQNSRLLIQMILKKGRPQ